MLPVTEALIERECAVQVRKWRESRGELTHQPGRRLHGTRAIYECKRRAAAISSGGSFSFLGSSVPPPGPLRSSSSLLSLPGFRKSKAPFQVQKKGSFSGPSGMEARMQQSPPAAVTPNQARGPGQKPPIPPAAGQRAPAPQSPLIRTAAAPSQGPPAPAEGQPAPASALSPSPKIVSEQITPTIPSPTANNAPLPPLPDPKRDAAPAADAPAGEEEGKKKKRSKEDKKKEKEDEKKKLKERKEKEKAEKERLKKEKERLEKEKKKGGKKRDKGGGGESEDKNGAAAAAKESA